VALQDVEERKSMHTKSRRGQEREIRVDDIVVDNDDEEEEENLIASDLPKAAPPVANAAMRWTKNSC
jgi:hypothetical protein